MFLGTMVNTFNLPISSSSLRLNLTLQSGQTFRWTEVGSNKWRGMIQNTLWSLSQDENFLKCTLHNTPKNKERISSAELEEYKDQVTKYFNLKVPLEDLYKQWCTADSKFSSISKDIPGLRLLNQDPLENVFSFICSSNNNINRITKLVEKLCSEFGQHVTNLEGADWYTFPPLTALADTKVESKLRDLGFGYRAKFICESAQTILRNGGENWLYDLKKLSYEDCHLQLKSLSGIGAKVADCICLMSMGHYSAVPVDTHVFQIASREYLPHLSKSKSLTGKVYKEIGDHFRKLYGDYAGWAHCVLFTADLKSTKRTLALDQKDQTLTKRKKISKSHCTNSHL